MIKQETIDLIRSKMDLAEVLGNDIKLKKNGSTLSGLCPFHNEKSPSFTVFNSTQKYKCFGCGASGDAITYLMKAKNLSFIESLEKLASDYNITVEYDNADKAQVAEIKEAKDEMRGVVKWAHEQYVKSLESLPPNSEALKYLQQREISAEVITKWEIGYAPFDNKFLSSRLINMGKFQPAADSGIVKVKEGISSDFFINRLTIPIRDINGNVVTFGGRLIPTGDDLLDKKYPKYLNGKESPLYSKSKVLFGLYEAVISKAIKNMGYAYLVEGYFDVISMHEGGLQNTIAPCGTALTEDQVKFLKRYTNHIVIMGDPDTAGMKAMMRGIDMFLHHDFKVEVVELPARQDPDLFIRKIRCGNDAFLNYPVIQAAELLEKDIAA